jgi:hypothetical protein
VTSNLRSLRGAALAAQTTLVIQVLFMRVVAAMALGALREMPADPLGTMSLDGTADGAVVWHDRMVYVLMAQAVIGYLAAATAVIVWLWRAHTNAERINESVHIPGGAIQRLGRPWVILGWVLPVVNYWFPRQVVADIWTASVRGQGMRLINAWWTLWVAFQLADLSTRVMAGPDSVASLSTILWITIAQTAAGIAAAILAIQVIRKITIAQQADAETIAHAESKLTEEPDSPTPTAP